jgi:hypothetical protein
MSGNVPLNVGVLDAKLTFLAAGNAARPSNAINNAIKSKVRAVAYLLPPRRGKIELGVPDEVVMNHPYLCLSPSRGRMGLATGTGKTPS